ncbi:hypothetical protein, partial [Escherichia coli]|uniref:hypothetical protein n=1 Tax=Escherichia coli TaxID=562 RepID=UPI001FF2A781
MAGANVTASDLQTHLTIPSPFWGEGQPHSHNPITLCSGHNNMKELVVVAIGGNSIIKDNASQSIEH